jgi:GDP-D-mannose 3',5'-epimerase
MKTALVLGAGGFIGSHLVKRLKSEGYWVRGVDIKYPEFEKSTADEMLIYDLTNPVNVEAVMRLNKNLYFTYLPQPFMEVIPFDEVYQLAADMGGAGYIFSGANDANVMHNSALINLHVAYYAVKYKIGKVFYSSSACMYPAYNQEDAQNPKCSEESAYPVAPDSEYGWEKLFSERLYLAFHRNYGLNVRIARFHNIFGPQGTWKGGKEKAPAAMCRKIVEVEDGGEIEVWGDGLQTRSFLYIDDCIEGVRRLMESDFTGPVNIGSEEMVTINKLIDMVSGIAGKLVIKNHISGPLGVRGRNSDNKLLKEKLGWAPSKPLLIGLSKTYNWIKQQHENSL